MRMIAIFIYTILILAECILSFEECLISKYFVPQIKTCPLSPSHVTYIAAVLEYEPYNKWNRDGRGQEVLRKNAMAFVKYTNQAKKQSVDIFITPEYGLQSGEMSRHYKTENFLTFTQYVPDPLLKIIPCSYNTTMDYFEAMRILSCGARDAALYLVVNLAEFCPCLDETVVSMPWLVLPSTDCPPEGYFIYNTQVVFDRSGTVIARYRKIHIYAEDGFTPGPRNDSTALFSTDFDVLFSLQICFDIMFFHPGRSNVKKFGVRDVAMSTAWFDQLPFEPADANQDGWSRGLATNLLVSGLHDPENYHLGSGIYRAYKEDPPVYTFNKNSGNVLLVAPVTTIAASSKTGRLVPQNSIRSLAASSNFPVTPIVNLAAENRSHSILHQNLSQHNRVLLQLGRKGQTFNVTLCSHDDFCCHLKYEYSGDLTYYFVVFSGLEPVGEGLYNLGVQQCGVLWCPTPDFSTCAYIEHGLAHSDLFGPFEVRSSRMVRDVLPIGITRDLSLIDHNNFHFESGYSYSVAAPLPVKDLLVAALYGRWFGRDGPGPSAQEK